MENTSITKESKWVACWGNATLCQRPHVALSYSYVL